MIGRFRVVALAVMVLVAMLPAAAQDGETDRGVLYDPSWYTADGGGVTSSAGVYSLSGTVGQPDAGAMSGGIYGITGGFWSGIAAPAGVIFADGLESGDTTSWSASVP